MSNSQETQKDSKSINSSEYQAKLNKVNKYKEAYNEKKILNIQKKINLTKQDTYSDLQKMKSPEHIKDVILGLRSEYKDRKELSLKALPSLIELCLTVCACLIK